MSSCAVEFFAREKDILADILKDKTLGEETGGGGGGTDRSVDVGVATIEGSASGPVMAFHN